MRSKLLLSLTAAALLGGAAYPLAFATSGERANCPGKVTCPITGDEVCKDRCPLSDAARTDCPGKVECPLTGDFVCRDECPVGTKVATENITSAVPICCRTARRKKTE